MRIPQPGSRLVGLAKKVAVLLTTMALLLVALEIGVRILTDIPPGSVCATR
jgi:hypothetical protein